MQYYGEQSALVVFGAIFPCTFKAYCLCHGKERQPRLRWSCVVDIAVRLAEGVMATGPFIFSTTSYAEDATKVNDA